jgi:YHS domain-containing protein
MLRPLLVTILFILLARALLRLVVGIREGFIVVGPSRGGPPARGVQMVRDPVCGMFILPEKALTLANHGQSVHFCSATCRDKYKLRTA